MKIRSGFVSNSSSSSFIAVGFLTTEVENNVDPKKEMLEQFSTRVIDDLASNYFDTDADYDSYRKGTDFPKFWEWAYNEKFGKSCAAPEDFDTETIDGKEYFVKRASKTTEYGSVEIDLDRVLTELENIKKEFPGANPKVFVTHNGD